MLDDDAASRGVFHRHVPAIKLHHFGAHFAMDGVQGGTANDRRGGFSGGQFLLSQKAVVWAAGMARLITLTCWWRRRQPSASLILRCGYQRYFPHNRASATVPPWPPLSRKTSIAACSAR